MLGANLKLNEKPKLHTGDCLNHTDKSCTENFSLQ